MTISTVAVTIVAGQFNGLPLTGGKVRIQATGSDVITGASGEIVVSEPQSLSIDSGTATANLITNTAGTQGTQYRFTFSDSYGADLFSVLATVPAFACNLHDIVDTPAPATVDAAQAAVNLARNWASQPTGTVDGTSKSAKAYAADAQAVLADSGFIAVHGDLANIDAVAGDLTNVNAVAGDLTNINLVSGDLTNINIVAADKANIDTVATDKANIDSVAANLTPINTNAANIAAIQSASANAGTATTQAGIATAQATTATNQASLSAGYAASAASVAQQDLSGVTAAALHRSPNAVVAMCIDDPRTWSDGGACLQRLDNLSWMNEPLQGAWLGGNVPYAGITSELLARALGGTQGANLVSGGDFSSGLTGWSPNGATISVVNGAMRVTNNVATFGKGTSPIATVAGQTYLMKIQYIGGTCQGGAVAGSAPNAVDLLNLVIPIAAGAWGYFVFTATTTTTYVGGFNNSSTGGQYADYDNISVQAVTALAPSGSYYPSATDGKFYRVWKNLLKFSADMTNAVYTRNGIAGVTSRADGLGDLIIPSAANVAHNINQQAGFPASGQQTVTVRAKAGGYSWLAVAAGGYSATYFDLTNGVLGTVNAGNTNPSITAVPGMAGYYDCSVTVGGPNWAAQGVQIAVANANNAVAFLADGLSGIYVAQAQVEFGTVATANELKTADGSQTEVFRGNLARYGRTAWVAEAGRTVAYAIDQPGRPAWMSITTGANFMLQGTITSVAATNGALVVGTNSGAFLINFAKDAATKYSTAADATFQGRISSRGVANGYL